MRGVSTRAIALALSPLLAACGVLLSIDESPAAPVIDDGGGADGRSVDEGAVDGSEAGVSASDACATAATCAPELVTTMGGSVIRLVVANNALYAGVAGAKPSVFRIDLAAPQKPLDLDVAGVVPEELRSDSNIAVEASGVVFWGTANGLRRRDADAAANASNDAGITTMSELGAPMAGVRIAGGRVHYTVAGPNGGAGANTGHLASCALPMCTDVQDVFYTPSPIDVIAIGGGRWWLGTDATLTNLTFKSLNGPPPASTEQLSPSRMVTDGSHIFWSTADALRMYTVATNTLVDLMPAGALSAGRVNGVVVETDGALYVTQAKAVKRCTIAADKCTFTELGAAASPAVDVAVDGTFVYWGNVDGTIMRLRKP
jgi:hypothetical protein